MKRIIWVSSLLFLCAPNVIAAQSLPYTDMDGTEWYAPAVRQLLDEGALDPSQPDFRAADRATRAEFAKLVVMLSGGILDETPERPSFNDVDPDDWSHPYLEEMAREGWMRGDGDCYDSTSLSPGGVGVSVCTIRPHHTILRAEAAAVLVRAFGRTATNGSPAFSDNPPGTWYTDAVQTAADHCLLRGDSGTRNVRPLAPLNRAEMAVMLQRIDEGMVFPACH